MWCSISHTVRSLMNDSSASRAGRDVVLRVDGLAHVVQQRRQQKLLVVGQPLDGQVIDLQAVVQRVTLGMELGACLTFSKGNSKAS